MHHRMRQDQNPYSGQIKDFDRRIQLALEKKKKLLRMTLALEEKEELLCMRLALTKKNEPMH